MMTDRELLEMAAKAAGYWSNEFSCVDKIPSPSWDPLGSDGDALRLSVQLQIDVKQYGDHVVGWFDGGFIGTGRIPYEGNPCKATRRAIVRAAAEIGMDMTKGK